MIALVFLLSLLANEETALKNHFRALFVRSPESALHIPCILPTNQFDGLAFTSQYGNRRHPIYGRMRHHNGIDIAVKGADVIATASGVVKEVGYSDGYGYFIKIDHLNGYETVYGHLSDIFVEADQQLTISTVIGKSGSTGSATGEHIHYEVKKSGIYLNPIFFVLLLYDILPSSYQKTYD